MMGRRRPKGTLGGWRPGAGRKAVFLSRVARSVSFEASEIEELEEIAEERGFTVAEVIRLAVQAYLKRHRKG